MEVTVSALREVSEAAELNLIAKRCDYAATWWATRGKRKALRAAKNGKKSVKVLVKDSHREAIKNFLKAKGFDAWDVERGQFFSVIRISWQ